MTTKRFWLILAALAVVRLVLMATTPVFDPSEARYAAISANMARTGDFVVPHFTYKGVYQSFDGKPPLVFQAGGVGCRIFGVTEFAVRLFPFLSAVLLLFILYRSVRREADDEAGRLAVVVTATSTCFFAAAGLSMTDMTLTCAVAGALLIYRSFAVRNSFADALGVAALLGVGMIVKGPVALVLFGLPVVVDAIVNRRWKAVFNVRWLAAAPVFLLIAVPWFVLIEQRNPGSVKYFFYNENFLRFVSHDYGDRYGAGREAFRGAALVWAFVACLPWALLPLVSALKAVRARGLRSWAGGVDWKNFHLLAALSITLFWCLTSRVLIYYLFPMIPLFAACLVRVADRRRIARFVTAAAGLSAVVLTAMLVGGSVFSDKMQGARTAYSAHGSTYAYEFYHGTHPEAKAKAEAKMKPKSKVESKDTIGIKENDNR